MRHVTVSTNGFGRRHPHWGGRPVKVVPPALGRVRRALARFAAAARRFHARCQNGYDGAHRAWLTHPADARRVQDRE